MRIREVAGPRRLLDQDGSMSRDDALSIVGVPVVKTMTPADGAARR